MTDVEKIALWLGLISSIISIVLSFVAIGFAILVDRSARAISAQTIKSLQKIDSDVERLSDDTRELIKAGWDKMLGSVDRGPIPSANNESQAKEIASGLVAELREELSSPKTEPDENSVVSPDQIQKLNELLERLEGTLTTQLRTQGLSERLSDVFDQVMSMLEDLSPVARSLATAITQRHLSSKRYRALMKGGVLSKALTELREKGVLVPLSGYDSEGKEIAVYYYPSNLAKTIRAVLPLLPSVPEDIKEMTEAELRRVGYYEDV